MSRIKIAAAIPTIVANPSDACCACSIAWPPSWTSSVADRADSAVEITRSTAALGSALARSSKLTVAKPIVPSREIACWPAAYGLTTLVTCGRRATRASVASIAARSAASVSVPVLAWNTIWSASPAWAGKLLCNRSTACCEPVPGSVKLLAVFFPTELETAKIPTTATIQATTTVRR